jgi:AbrB family looped-hinge helix DNA binding protein
VKIKVDRSGRVRLPKQILDSLRLAPGSSLEIDSDGGVVRLRPVADKSVLAEHSGVWVFAGVAQEDVSEAVKKLRKARNRRMGGVDRPSTPRSSL